MVTAVIDCDLILWKAASAGEQRSIIVTHKKSGRKQEFANRRALKDFIKTRKKWTAKDFEIKDFQRPPKLESCLHIARRMINDYAKSIGAKKVELYLGKGDSFRKFLDLPAMYKGNRLTAIKPVHFAAVRSFLIHKMGAVEVEDIETDDMLSIRSYEGFVEYSITRRSEDFVVQITTDKDGRQCKGWLYNPNKMRRPKWIDGYGRLFRDGDGDVDGYGNAWLYFQLLAGDPADAYKPSALAGVRYGDVAAYDALKHCKDDYEALRVVIEQYKEWYPEPVTYKTWDGRKVTKDWLGLAELYFQAARMLRWRDESPSLESLLVSHGLAHSDTFAKAA